MSVRSRPLAPRAILPSTSRPGAHPLPITPSAGWVRRLFAGLVASVLGVTVLVFLPEPAAADPNPPVIPSQAQVDAAKAAVSGQAAAVAAVEAQYAQANAQLAAVQHEVSQAAREYAAAQAAEQAATDAAASASAEADRATQAARAAQDELSRTAAAAYESGGSSNELMLGLVSGGPQRALDLAQYLDDAAGSLDRQLQQSTLLSGVADSARRIAADRAQLAHDTAQVAADALARLQTRVEQAGSQVAAIGAQQTALVAQLATLQHTSQQLEQQRLDGLAAQAAAAAAAKAAAAKAAQEAAARAAAEAAAKAAAEQAARASQRTPPAAGSSGSTGATSGSTTGSSGGSSGGSTSSGLAWAQAHPRTVAQQLMPKFGFGTDQWSCLDALWEHESSWYWAADNPYSSAYGIPQSLPGTKMASAGSDWLVNPATQITWGLGYIKAVYGNPCNAWSVWQSRSPHWY